MVSCGSGSEEDVVGEHGEAAKSEGVGVGETREEKMEKWLLWRGATRVGMVESVEKAGPPCTGNRGNAGEMRPRLAVPASTAPAHPRPGRTNIACTRRPSVRSSQSPRPLALPRAALHRPCL